MKELSSRNTSYSRTYFNIQQSHILVTSWMTAQSGSSAFKTVAKTYCHQHSLPAMVEHQMLTKQRTMPFIAIQAWKLPCVRCDHCTFLIESRVSYTFIQTSRLPAMTQLVLNDELRYTLENAQIVKMSPAMQTLFYYSYCLKKKFLILTIYIHTMLTLTGCYINHSQRR